MDVMPWEVAKVRQVPGQATDLSNEDEEMVVVESLKVKVRDKGPEGSCAGYLEKVVEALEENHNKLEQLVNIHSLEEDSERNDKRERMKREVECRRKGSKYLK